MTGLKAKLDEIERELLHDRFADFERAVLQDNIVLCDTKAGILLAFTSAMVIFLLDSLISEHQGAGPLAFDLLDGLFLGCSVVFLLSCYFSLLTVLPRLRHGKDSHVFWESKVFTLTSDEYVDHMEKVDLIAERRDKLHHLHMLAGICRDKFNHFRIAVRVAQGAFILLVASELVKFFVMQR